MAQRGQHIPDGSTEPLRSRFSHLHADTAQDLNIKPDAFGDLYWVNREAWKGCGGLGNDPDKPFRPGLVTELHPDRTKPLEMAPGSKTRDERPIHGMPAQVFRPDKPIDWIIHSDRRPPRQYFVLYYFRPVARCHVAALMGRISEVDRKRLAIEIEAARMIADMVREAEELDA